MPVRGKALMDGTTLCRHCDTRFKITEAQLAAHHGMVRCGHCLQIFDARTSFTPDQPSPQLELPIAEETPTATVPASSDEPDASNALQPAEEAVQSEAVPDENETDTTETVQPDVNASSANEEHVVDELPQSSTLSPEGAEAELAENTDNETHDLAEPTAIDNPQDLHGAPQRPLTLAEQISIVHDEEGSALPPKRRNWPWAMASLLLLLGLVAQAAYLFRIDLAARMPALKPALVEYCRLLNCSIPLPQHVDAMSIESSSLEADTVHANQITLNALLRNRAAYAQAFPSLELTLNDTQDQPLARRTFRPADYLPPVENEKNGLLPNHEISIKLPLDTTDLKPTGYRLVLFYPG